MNDEEPFRWEDHELAAPVERCLTVWNLSDPVPIANSRIGLVLSVRRLDGSRAALKCLSEIGRREEGSAASVLRAFDGRGAVRVFASTEGALLMEFCSGNQLNAIVDGGNDGMAVAVICDVVRRLHADEARPPEMVRTLAARCSALEIGLGLAADTGTRRLFAEALEVRDQLIATQGRGRLLHGDIHHENIMKTRRAGQETWISIDPQGIVGELAYEVANVFGNPRDVPAIVLDPERPARLADRFAAELGLCRTRILGWAFVHSCISAAWVLKDGGDPGQRLAVAENVAQVPGGVR